MKNISSKLLWTGLGFMLALNPFLKVFGGSGDNEIIVAVGAVLFIIGVAALWFYNEPNA